MTDRNCQAVGCYDAVETQKRHSLIEYAALHSKVFHDVSAAVSSHLASITASLPYLVIALRLSR